MTRLLAIAIGLFVLAYVMNGAYIYLDARNSQPIAGKLRSAPAASASTPAVSSATAPWAENYAKFRRGEYSTSRSSAFPTSRTW